MTTRPANSKPVPRRRLVDSIKLQTSNVISRFLAAEREGGSTPLGHILSNLDVIHLAAVAKSSTQMNTLSKQDLLWTPLYQKHWPLNTIGCAGRSPTRDDYRKRHQAELEATFKHRVLRPTLSLQERYDFIVTATDFTPVPCFGAFAECVFNGEQKNVTVDSSRFAAAPSIKIDNTWIDFEAKSMLVKRASTQTPARSPSRSTARGPMNNIYLSLSIFRHSDGAIAQVYDRVRCKVDPEDEAVVFGDCDPRRPTGTEVNSMRNEGGTVVVELYFPVKMSFADHSELPTSVLINPTLYIHDCFGYDKGYTKTDFDFDEIYFTTSTLFESMRRLPWAR